MSQENLESEESLEALAECVGAVRGRRTDDRSTSYATLE